ncbi:putative erythromycin esterase [Tricladium varicosporioides]|nr:putative erythromycin esterase [Hymenoscyphus varicosporioides]
MDVSPVQDLLRENVEVLPLVSDPSFATHFHQLGKYKIVLLGDGSHGTSEFYEARAKITQHLIEHHGFNIVAVEADWPDAEAIDRYVRRRPGPTSHVVVNEDEAAFKRFPRWMWRNHEVHDFVEWLREHNKGLGREKKAGFYGLDLYSMGTSIQAVIKYLDHIDPKMAMVARKRYGSLQPWAENPHEYGLGALVGAFKSCEEDVLKMLKQLLGQRLEYSSHPQDGEEFHSSEQNARVIADAERYYKAMYYSNAQSWNLRDTHMFETLNRLLEQKGKSAKAVVWAHNSHLGDARGTSMGWNRQELNIGQLLKQKFGNNVVSLGCGTHAGTVAAADEWDSDMRIMEVNPSLPDSYEMLAHQTGIPRFFLDLRKEHCNPDLRAELMKKRLERFIGVIYRPSTERQSHYSQAILPQQFDGYIWFDETKAVKALEVHQPKTPLELDETYPFGL